MASINGISLKKIQQFPGHDGVLCSSADIYFRNQKIGTWSQSTWGGPDHFDLNYGLSERELNQAISKANPDKTKTYKRDDGSTFSIKYDLEQLMNDLILLYEDQTTFEKANKIGYSGVLIVSDYYHNAVFGLKDNVLFLTDKEIVAKYKNTIADAKEKNGFFKEDESIKHRINIYRHKTDFKQGKNLALDIDLEKNEIVRSRKKKDHRLKVMEL